MEHKSHRLRIRRRFEAAHRVATSDSDCRHLHGHSFEVYYTFASDRLEGGMVIDSNLVKGVVDGHIAELDHALLVDRQHSSEFAQHAEALAFKYVLFDGVPTAEYLAEYLFRKAKNLLPTLVRVEVRETENLVGIYEIEC
jgi:6-pyruvoyltetrahydropterin/6-carboxytetrahydropterin synthase